MKLKQDKLQRLAYILFCIATFGFVAIVRLIITQAILMAFEDKQ